MDAVIDMILERYRQLLRSGAYLVDPNDPGEEIRALFYLEHSILAGGDSRHAVSRQTEIIDRTYSAVKDRLTKEIAYWDHRAEELKAQEQSGKFNARLNSEMARRRAADLRGRFRGRLG